MRVTLGSFFKLLDHNRGRVRDLFFGLHQDLLPDDFRHHETHGLVGDLVFGKIARAFGQEPQHLVQKHFEAFVFSGGERNDFPELMELPVLIHDGKQFFLGPAQKIDLVQQQEDRRP